MERGNKGKEGDLLSKRDLRDNSQWKFPAGLVVMILGFHCHGPGFNPWLGTEIPPSCGVPAKNEKEIVVNAIWDNFQTISRN